MLKIFAKRQEQKKKEKVFEVFFGSDKQGKKTIKRLLKTGAIDFGDYSK